jgi:GT2 family glycosyltransferase
MINEIIVVGNVSKDGSVELIKKSFPNVTILKNKVNRGAAGGYSDGMKYAYKRVMILYGLLTKTVAHFLMY